jgi:hypothetical protein
VTEKQFQAQVVQLARLYRWDVYHTHDSRRSDPGFPDLVLSRGSVLMVAELKTDVGETTEEQDKWLDRFRAANIPAHLWRPRDWNVIQEALK